jgi:hypothetical protein
MILSSRDPLLFVFRTIYFTSSPLRLTHAQTIRHPQLSMRRRPLLFDSVCDQRSNIIYISREEKEILIFREDHEINLVCTKLQWDGSGPLLVSVHYSKSLHKLFLGVRLS